MKIGGISIVNKTRIKLPRLPLRAMKEDILGKKYSLSIALVNEKESRRINIKYRRKNRPTNVLSFPLKPLEGEMVLCPAVIRRESRDEEKNFGKNFRELFGFLLIHGMLHLKDMRHGSKMDRQEEHYDKKYFSRNRRRIVHDSRRGRRVLKRRKKS